MQRSPAFFYLLSFIEGASVMAAELIGAKMLAPYFGSSLYVWSSVMAVTLGGLALGYFLGGVLSHKRKGRNVLYYVMFVAAVLVILMPFTSKIVFAIVGDSSLLPSVILSTTIFLLPPVFMLGMISPLIIRNIAHDHERSGRVAGAVYAISTVGGIVSTFLTGFWIIPSFGLSNPCIVAGIILGIIPLAMIFRKNKITAVFFIALISWSVYKIQRPLTDQYTNIPYLSEGMLGQLMVADYPNFINDSVTDGTNRILFVNRITQSQLNEQSGAIKHFAYVEKITEALKVLPHDSRILLMGLGGGSLANELVKMGLNVEVCELDSRIAFVAKTWFKLDPRVLVNISDARRFIRHSKGKYDVIIFDVFRGEENPGHCFTTEAFLEAKNMLNENGLVIVNGNGFFQGSKGKGMRSLCLTFQSSGFQVSVVPTAGEEAWRNLVFFASPVSAKNENKNYYASVFGDNYLDVRKYDFSKDIVMSDDRPVLDQLNAEAYKCWRVSSISYFLSESRKGRGVPVFR